MPAWWRPTSASAPTAPWSSRSIREALERDLKAAVADGITSVAIVLMHSYAHPQHERQAAELARAAGFTQISVSHEVSPLIKIVGRGDTTVADAYLSPILRRYVEKVAGAIGVRPSGSDTSAEPVEPRCQTRRV